MFANGTSESTPQNSRLDITNSGKKQQQQFVGGHVSVCFSFLFIHQTSHFSAE
jgi:hypothetical protein